MNWMDVSTPLGTMRLQGEGRFLTGAHFHDGRYLPKNWGTEGEIPVLADARHWLDCYFAGETLPALPPVAPAGTAFQQAVWEILTAIPYGETMSYGLVANLLAAGRGRQVAAQAVGQAVGRNPISIFIPCHRVLAAGHGLGGYGGALWRKEYLLQLENIGYYKNIT